jgi:hypothetical protein
MTETAEPDWFDENDPVTLTYKQIDERDKTIAAEAFAAGLEKAAKIAEGGSFLHNDAPTARFGRECAAAIRREIKNG